MHAFLTGLLFAAILSAGTYIALELGAVSTVERYADRSTEVEIGR